MLQRRERPPYRHTCRCGGRGSVRATPTVWRAGRWKTVTGSCCPSHGARCGVVGWIVHFGERREKCGPAASWTVLELEQDYLAAPTTPLGRPARAPLHPTPPSAGHDSSNQCTSLTPAGRLETVLNKSECDAAASGRQRPPPARCALTTLEKRVKTPEHNQQQQQTKPKRINPDIRGAPNERAADRGRQPWAL